MKRKTISAVLAFAMVLGASVSVSAAPSISQIIPENPQVVSGSLEAGQELVVQNAATDAYENTAVAETVAWANDDSTIATTKEILTRLAVDTKQEFRTEDGTKINPTLFEQLTPFVDLAIRSGDQVTYNSNGSIQTKVTIEAAKDMEKDDLMIMQIDPNTGKVYFVSIEELDGATGEITATFPTLGPISLLKTVPIVTKSVSPERYPHAKTAEVVKKFIDEKKDIRFEDVLDAMEVLTEADGTRKTQIEVAENVTVDIAKYTTAMGFTDLAIKAGEDGYLYDMDGSLQADARRDIKEIDWERLVKDADANFDTAAAAEDMSKLVEMDPFVVDESFLMQINPVSGEAEYIYEPEMFFAYPQDDTSEVVTPSELEVSEKVHSWSVHDEDKEQALEEEAPDLVIRAEYKSMGPFALFLPSSAQ